MLRCTGSALFTIWMLLLAGSSKSSAATWTLSQQGLLALDYQMNPTGAVVSVTPRGQGVEYQISFNSQQAAVHLLSSSYSGNGALLGLPLTPSDTFALKFTLLSSPPNANAYIAAGAIINVSGTWGYSPVAVGGPYSNTGISTTATDESETRTIGFIAYITDSSGWPASGGTVKLLVEPAPNAALLAPANTVGSGLRFVPVTPCRVLDTRLSTGPLGGPAISAGQSRDIPIPSAGCGVPATALAYALNATVVPHGPLGYLTLWPAGQGQPMVSTLNALDGRIKANAALVPSGLNGSINAFASDTTDLVLDINGYFLGPGDPIPGGLVYYPVTPCRLVDTRSGSAVGLGGPILFSGERRAFPLLHGNCGLPPTARAYALNVTAVPQGPLGYLSLWAIDQPQPYVSTLNAPTGTVVPNMAIVPAGTNGSIVAYVTNPADLIIDVNGYFAPPGAPGGLSFSTVPPCRVLDTRGPAGALGGPVMPGGTARPYPLAAGACGLPPVAGAYSLNATVVPQGPLGYLSLWPAGSNQPLVSTLNSLDGAVAANAALIPSGVGGNISAFVSNTSHLVLDANGYFQTPGTYSILQRPVPLSPADGSVFSTYPRTTTVTWTSVPGATGYGVEVQYCQAGVTLCREFRIATTASPTYTFDFIGAQPGRWRVWTIDSTTGRASAVSNWYTFYYTI